MKGAHSASKYQRGNFVRREPTAFNFHWTGLIVYLRSRYLLRTRDFELRKKDRLTDLTDEELDAHITALTAGNRLLGPNMVKAK